MLEARVFFDEDDRYQGHPVHDHLLHHLMHAGIAGATVFAAFKGFGEKHRVHEPRRLTGSDEGPLMLIFVDEEAKVRAVLPHIRDVVGDGLIVLCKVERA